MQLLCAGHGAPTYLGGIEAAAPLLQGGCSALRLLPKLLNPLNLQAHVAGTHVSQLLETRLGLLASICQSTTRIQVMTRL